MALLLGPYGGGVAGVDAMDGNDVVNVKKIKNLGHWESSGKVKLLVGEYGIRGVSIIDVDKDSHPTAYLDFATHSRKKEFDDDYWWIDSRDFSGEVNDEGEIHFKISGLDQGRFDVGPEMRRTRHFVFEKSNLNLKLVDQGCY